MILNSFILKQSLDMYPSKNNVMDVMTGCFECFCSINKKSILCLFLLTC